MKLQTLAEWNEAVKYRLDTQNTGIECPNCGTELIDDPAFRGVMLSYPGQVNVKCLDCNWSGTRYYNGTF